MVVNLNGREKRRERGGRRKRKTKQREAMEKMKDGKEGTQTKEQTDIETSLRGWVGNFRETCGKQNCLEV